jgi:hypothetical protein
VAAIDEQRKNLELGRLREELIPSDVVFNQAYTMAATAKARLMSLIGSLPARLAGQDKNAIFETLNKEFRWALEDISKLIDRWKQEDLAELMEHAKQIQARVKATAHEHAG